MGIDTFSYAFEKPEESVTKIAERETTEIELPPQVSLGIEYALKKLEESVDLKCNNNDAVSRAQILRNFFQDKSDRLEDEYIKKCKPQEKQLNSFRIIMGSILNLGQFIHAEKRLELERNGDKREKIFDYLSLYQTHLMSFIFALDQFSKDKEEEYCSRYWKMIPKIYNWVEKKDINNKSNNQAYNFHTGVMGPVGLIRLLKQNGIKTYFATPYQDYFGKVDLWAETSPNNYCGLQIKSTNTDNADILCTEVNDNTVRNLRYAAIDPENKIEEKDIQAADDLLTFIQEYGIDVKKKHPEYNLSVPIWVRLQGKLFNKFTGELEVETLSLSRKIKELKNKILGKGVYTYG